jgi:CheY-like chemotaxis protein
MAHLLSITDAQARFEIADPPKSPNPPEIPSPSPTKSTMTAPKTALAVEHEAPLVKLWRSHFEDEGYTVSVASNTEEALHLYRDFGPFNVVLVDYFVPPTHGHKINVLAPVQTHGTALGITIRAINPSQPMIIAALDYQNAAEVSLPTELVHVPVLIDASDFRLRRLLAKIDVDRAVEALTSSELLRLQRFADYRIQGLGRAARGRTGEDLLSEALLRTLIGAGATRGGRHWNKHVDFVWHLTGAMRSISSCWKRQFKGEEPHLMSELLKSDAEGQQYSQLENLPATHIPADQRLIEKGEEHRVLTIFKDDSEATQVLQGLLDGLKKNEIGLEETKYAAAVKRILKLLGRKNAGSKG